MNGMRLKARGALPPLTPRQGPSPWNPSSAAAEGWGPGPHALPTVERTGSPRLGTIVIAAGGTAGHVFPAEALVEELRARGWRPVVFTDRRAAERGFGGAERHVLAGAGIAGRGLRRGVAAVWSLAAGTLAAQRTLARLRPRVVVGFGGYPSVAPVLAARLVTKRPRIVLHEQNAVLGRANRALAPFSDRLAVSFAATRHAPGTAVVTGNPVRAAVQALSGHRYAPPGDGPFSILVLGGSLGARVFSDLVPAALAALPTPARLRVVQQCRAEDLERVRTAYAEAGVVAELSAFFPDAPVRLAAAHLVVARAGASTVAELVVLGRPSLLVPLPGAIDDHQRANAAALAQAGAAVVLDQRNLTAERFGAEVASLLGDSARLVAMAEAAARFGRPDAGKKLADIVEALATGETPA